MTTLIFLKAFLGRGRKKTTNPSWIPPYPKARVHILQYSLSLCRGPLTHPKYIPDSPPFSLSKLNVPTSLELWAFAYSSPKPYPGEDINFSSLSSMALLPTSWHVLPSRIPQSELSSILALSTLYLFPCLSSLPNLSLWKQEPLGLNCFCNLHLALSSAHGRQHDIFEGISVFSPWKPFKHSAVLILPG